jgi:hypothetical protein
MRFLIFLVCFSFSSLYGQIGFRGGYGTYSFDDWKTAAYNNEPSKTSEFLNTGFHLSVDYSFRLKKRRIEFLPAVSYYNYGQSTINDKKYTASSLDFAFNTHIYILDLEEDCDCPTFSKQGNTIKKGFFFHIAPIAKYFLQDINATGTNAFAIGLKGGLGLDIGINDLFTISPILSYQRTSRVSWTNLNKIANSIDNPSDVESDFSGFNAELRLGFRFDQKKGFKRR